MLMQKKSLSAAPTMFPLRLACEALLQTYGNCIVRGQFWPVFQKGCQSIKYSLLQVPQLQSTPEAMGSALMFITA